MTRFPFTTNQAEHDQRWMASGVPMRSLDILN